VSATFVTGDSARTDQEIWVAETGATVNMLAAAAVKN